jgi:hypothetical protein
MIPGGKYNRRDRAMFEPQKNDIGDIFPPLDEQKEKLRPVFFAAS